MNSGETFFLLICQRMGFKKVDEKSDDAPEPETVKKKVKVKPKDTSGQGMAWYYYPLAVLVLLLVLLPVTLGAIRTTIPATCSCLNPLHKHHGPSSKAQESILRTLRLETEQGGTWGAQPFGYNATCGSGPCARAKVAALLGGITKEQYPCLTVQWLSKRDLSSIRSLASAVEEITQMTQCTIIGIDAEDGLTPDGPGFAVQQALKGLLEVGRLLGRNVVEGSVALVVRGTIHGSDRVKSKLAVLQMQ
jgi:hypothetical protein